MMFSRFLSAASHPDELNDAARDLERAAMTLRQRARDLADRIARKAELERRFADGPPLDHGETARLRRLERDRKILHMARRMTNAEIAHRLGLHRNTVSAIVRRELRRAARSPDPVAPDGPDAA